MEALVGEDFVAAVREHRRTMESEPQPAPSAEVGSPISRLRINIGHSSLNTEKHQSPAGGGFQYKARGYGLVYLRQGSSPAGRLLVNIAGQKTEMTPGMRFKGEFAGFAVHRTSAVPNVTNGLAGSEFAELVVLNRPDADFDEIDESTSGALFPPVDLWANWQQSGAAISGTLETAPTLSTDGFSVTGFSKVVLVVVDSNTPTKLTSFTVVPWFMPDAETASNGSSVWLSADGNRLSVPDSLPTKQRYRVLEIETHGLSGRMFFTVTDDAGAAFSGGGLGVGFYAMGVR